MLLGEPLALRVPHRADRKRSREVLICPTLRLNALVDAGRLGLANEVGGRVKTSQGGTTCVVTLILTSLILQLRGGDLVTIARTLANDLGTPI